MNKLLKLSILGSILLLTTTGKHAISDDSKEYQRTDEAIAKLTKKQKYVVLYDGTELPFENAFWDHKEEGIYVDTISGEPLFSSTDKFDSGSGWPSFTKPIDDNFINTREDKKLMMTRIEVRSKNGDAHLGHLFNDGPKEAGGKRYCINSASLTFVPKTELAERGYEKYLSLF